MEGLRVSKLEEGQQWGKNTSSKDKVHWGRRPPFIEGEKSNRYVLSPHTSGTTAPRAVLPLRKKKQGKGATKHEPWGGSTAYKRYYRAPQRYYRWRSRIRDQKTVEVLPLIGGTTAHQGGTTAYRWNCRALLPCNYCKTRHEKCKTQNRGGTSAEP